MNTLTLSLPYIAALRKRLNRGLHLQVLFVLNEYLPYDPMATVMVRYLVDHARHHAPHKVELLEQCIGKTLESQDKQRREYTKLLMNQERNDGATPYRRRPIPTARRTQQLRSRRPTQNRELQRSRRGASQQSWSPNMRPMPTRAHTQQPSLWNRRP